MDSGIEISDYFAETTLRFIGDKWEVLIIRDLLIGTKRFSELIRSVSGIARKVLTNHLRTMEQAGLVIRKIYPQVLPKVEYTPTETGRSLKPIPDSVTARGAAYKKNTGQTRTQKEP